MRENCEHGQNIMTRIYEEGGGCKWLASGGIWRIGGKDRWDEHSSTAKGELGCKIVVGKSVRSDLSYLSSTLCVPVITSTC
jgi:hypothetical protein